MIRSAKPEEFKPLGQLMVKVYSHLDGFPKPDEQPDYYAMLSNIGEQVQKPDVELLVAVDTADQLLGGVVFFGDMQFYGSGGTAPQAKQATGFRLLAVSDNARGRGVGRLLTEACIERSVALDKQRIIIHTTEAMKVAWRMYEKQGFTRAEEFDFMQEKLAVFGFHKWLNTDSK